MIVPALWNRLHEPRWVTAAAIVQYTLGGLVGLSLIVLPPYVPVHTWSIVAGLVMSVALIVGAIIAGVSCFRGVWGLERVGILIVLVAYLAQAPMLWPLFDTAEWHLLITLSVLEAAAGLMPRFYMIRWAYLDPMRG